MKNKETKEEKIKRDKVTNRIPNEEPREESDLDKIQSGIEMRLAYLHTLKQHRYSKFLEFKEEYKGNFVNSKSTDEIDYRMNTGFAIVNTKFSEVLANTPAYDFIALDDAGKQYKIVRERLWRYYWIISKTDKALANIILDSLKYGIGFGKEFLKLENRTVKKVGLVDGKVQYQGEEVVPEYDAPFLEHLQWEDVLINGRNIDETTECAIIKHIDRDEFFALYPNNPNYSGVTEDNIPYGKRYFTQSLDTAKVNTDDGQTKWVSTPDTVNRENWNIVSIVEYYNKSRDQFILTANGKWINPIFDEKGNIFISPIPFLHHQIPIVTYTDYVLSDDIYSMGELDITKNSRNLKNDVRSKLMETADAMLGFTTIDPTMGDFDEATISIGAYDFARIPKEAVGHFSPNINTNGLQYLEAKVDEDLIVESGIDHRGQILSPNETAAKTDSRTGAGKKRINSHIKFNAYDFYERLARLRSSNIELLHSGKTKTIFLEGIDIDEKGKKMNVDGYGTFTVRPEHMEGKFNVLPIMESMMGDSTQKQKQTYVEILQLWGNMKKADGTPAIDSNKLIELGRAVLPGIDIDMLLQTTPAKQSPQQIVDNSGVFNDPMQPSPTEGELPAGYVPAAQRSGAVKSVPILPSSPKLQ